MTSLSMKNLQEDKQWLDLKGKFIQLYNLFAYDCMYADESNL